ncbi:hypothetical protein MMC22_008740 [Lobaria immixta]|nr:hypothetical protein [Lobaria immixta]
MNTAPIHESVAAANVLHCQKARTASEASVTGIPGSLTPIVDDDDPACARNWSTAKKLCAVATGLLLNFNTTLSSSLPSGAIDSLNDAFDVSSHQQVSLPVAVFLVGYIFGPVVFSPVSESFGRRVCFITSFGLYTLFTLACAFAPNWPALLVFRFLVGAGASAPQAVLGGMYADLYPNLSHRGRAVMILGLMSNLGPLIGPIIAGYTSTTNWRWMFWVALIMAGATWPLLLLLPGNLDRRSLVVLRLINLRTETFAPVILRRHHAAAGSSLEKSRFPTTNLKVTGTYGMSSGKAAVMLLPIGIGAAIAMFVFLWYDRFLIKSKEQGKAWTQREEYRRLPLACAGGPLYAISQFWLAWTARPDIHWIVPALSGIPYGIGIDLTFMALTNYLTDAYDIYSASALASSVFSRNIVAALLLPLATYRLYEDLGVGWACSLLGFLCLALSPIPFVFLRYGPSLRAKSPFCQRLKQLRRGPEDS